MSLKFTFERSAAAVWPRFGSSVQIDYGTTMVSVVFTENIQRHVACPPSRVAGATIGEVLDHAFQSNQRARGYVLDERGAVRKHMVVFLNGTPIRDRENLTDVVPDGSEVYIMQALSGG